MNTALRYTICLALIVIAVLMNGCVTEHKQVLTKVTLFGADIKTPGPSGTAIEVMIGLVRTLYFSNPVNSNGAAPPFSSTSHGDVGLFNQKVDESFGTEQPPEIAYKPAPVSTADPLTGDNAGGLLKSSPTVTPSAGSGIPANNQVGVTPSSVPADLTPAPRVGLPTTMPK